MSSFSPKEIVFELNRHIVGQDRAKRAIATAMRNRWRRKKVEKKLRQEITPKNILMIGTTGVGKTEIARRLARLTEAPFIKVEATKFTEVGYVGRDVEQIIRDLAESAMALLRKKHRDSVKARAQTACEERVLDAIVGKNASETTRNSFQKKLHAGELDDREIEIDLVNNTSPLQGLELPNMPGAHVGMLNLGDLMKGFPKNTKTVKMKVQEAFDPLMAEESDKLLDEDKLTQQAVKLTQEDGIVFIDEIDKITAKSNTKSADVSREGVQRDLLPLIEGTTVSTKYGPVVTDHILFISSGAFQVSKPSDLLPELQGRLPIRVELDPLTKEDFKRILFDTESSLIKQYSALMKTEGLSLTFTREAIMRIAELSFEINSSVENIGARRLHTVIEKLLEEISFNASEMSGEALEIDAKYVDEHVGVLVKNIDVSKFIL